MMLQIKGNAFKLEEHLNNSNLLITEYLQRTILNRNKFTTFIADKNRRNSHEIF